jgi:hypothetical protein
LFVCLNACNEQKEKKEDAAFSFTHHHHPLPSRSNRWNKNEWLHIQGEILRDEPSFLSFFLCVSSKVQYLSMKPFFLCSFSTFNSEGGKKRKCYLVIWIESQTTIVCWASNGYLSTPLYKQTVIHSLLNEQK